MGRKSHVLQYLPNGPCPDVADPFAPVCIIQTGSLGYTASILTGCNLHRVDPGTSFDAKCQQALPGHDINYVIIKYLAGGMCAVLI